MISRSATHRLTSLLLRATQRLSILFVKESEYLPNLYGGVELATDGLCHLLRRRFHSVAVVAISDACTSGVPSPLRQDIECGVYTWNGYPVHVAHRLADALEQAINARAPDVVVLQEFILSSWSAVKSIVANTPVVFYQHSLNSTLSELYLDESVRRRERVTFLSSSNLVRDYALQFGTASTVVHPLFGIERYHGGQRVGDDIVMISIQPKKGADIALEIARLRPNNSFVFVDSWTNSMRDTWKLLRELRRLPNVTILPNVADMTEIFKNAKLLLMPSRYEESWGRVATEAQLFGIPVLGSNRGQLPNTIGPGGVTLDPDSGLSVWLQEFDRIVGDPACFQTMSNAAKKHSQDALSWAERAERDFLTAIYSVTRSP